jgi:tetratricopeptide (TPR) repeat protein
MNASPADKGIGGMRRPAGQSPARSCASCGRPLSRYNDGEYCGPCSSGEQATSGPGTGPQQTTGTTVGPARHGRRVHGENSVRKAKQALRERMLADGLAQRQIAGEFGSVFGMRPRAAWRESRGWSLTEATRRINLYRAAAGIDPAGCAGMTAAHLSEHETWPGYGAKPAGRRPSLQLLAVLASVYDCDLIDLIDPADRTHLPAADLLVIDSTIPASPPAPAGSERGLPARSRDSAVQADCSGIDEVSRRELLRIMTVMGAVTAAPASFGDHGRARAPGTEGISAVNREVDLLGSQDEQVWRVFALARAKQAVFPLVRDHLDDLADQIARAGSDAARRRLCGFASSAFQLSGEILFDGNLYTDAAHCYALAATVAREAGAADLQACALTRHAFISLYEQRYDRASQLLDLAAGLARHGDQSLATRHWIAAVHAQALAGLGDLTGCQRALDTAATIADLTGPVHNGGWMRFDGTRLAEESGTCYLKLQRYDLAEPALTSALSQALSDRRRGQVLTDLALLAIHRHNIDQACAYGGEAAQIAWQTTSGFLARKLTQLQSRLPAPANDSRLRDLHDRISTITTTRTAAG